MTPLTSKNISGTLYILTAPSGAGKTTLARQLIASMDNIQLSVSYTTRAIRPGEVSGKDYWFVDDAQFNTMLEEDAFLEHAHVHSYYYGTSRQRVTEQLKAGIDVILAIDWQGARQVRQLFENDVVSIFILPPSKAILQKRLHLRGQDDAAVINKRLDAAKGEIAHYTEFDYVVVNNVLEEAIRDIQSIVRARRLLGSKQALYHAELLAEWLGDE
jgi:guanylate kinase